MCLGVPAKIICITDPEEGLAMVETFGVSRIVNLSLLALQGISLNSLVERWVLIHVGFAMAEISESDALSNLELLKVDGALQHE